MVTRFYSPALFFLSASTSYDPDFAWTIFRQRTYIYSLRLLGTDPDRPLIDHRFLDHVESGDSRHVDGEDKGAVTESKLCHFE